MADPSITVEELAKKAELPLQCLDKAFREEEACLLAEFCDQWEFIGYHLRLVKTDITTIKNDNDTTDLRRISMLVRWSGKFAHKATYRVLIEALIRSKHANKALELCQTLRHELAVNSRIESDADAELVTATSVEQKGDVCTREDVIPDTDIVQSIDYLRMQFVCVQNHFLQSGPGTGLTLEQLQTCVSTLPSFTTDKPQALLEASSVQQFIHNLKGYCCALNPDILEGLIEVLGDIKSKSMMEKYKGVLHVFRCKTKLKDFVGNYDGPTPPEYKEVQLKLGDDWREKTLADLSVITSQISRQSWLVKMVSVSSIYVRFMIPQEDDLELGIHIRNFLQSQCVLQIIVGGVCIFNCEDVQLSGIPATNESMAPATTVREPEPDTLSMVDSGILGSRLSLATVSTEGGSLWDVEEEFKDFDTTAGPEQARQLKARYTIQDDFHWPFGGKSQTQILAIKCGEHRAKLKLHDDDSQITEIIPDQSSQQPSSHRGFYSMKAEKHGVALIINNKVFLAKEHKVRTGTDRDEYNLIETWLFLGYHVVILRDCTRDEMAHTFEKIDHLLKSVAGVAHDSFVCFILSHGLEEVVFGSDSRPLGYAQIQRCLAKSEILRSRPKLLFIEAGQGISPGAKVLADRLNRQIDSDDDKISECTDFYLSCTSVHGNCSYRDIYLGTWFISELCQTLCKRSMVMDLDEIQKEVNERVVLNHTFRDYKQQPRGMDQLRKKVFFFPQ